MKHLYDAVSRMLRYHIGTLRPVTVDHTPPDSIEACVEAFGGVRWFSFRYVYDTPTSFYIEAFDDVWFFKKGHNSDDNPVWCRDLSRWSAD